jgi:hypothetical protein
MPFCAIFEARICYLVQPSRLPTGSEESLPCSGSFMGHVLTARRHPPRFESYESTYPKSANVVYKCVVIRRLRKERAQSY